MNRLIVGVAIAGLIAIAFSLPAEAGFTPKKPSSPKGGTGGAGTRLIVN